MRPHIGRVASRPTSITATDRDNLVWLPRTNGGRGGHLIKLVTRGCFMRVVVPLKLGSQVTVD
ncbi:hypothetical protein GCM10020218_038510 [Dactylosporangium vinaceum]